MPSPESPTNTAAVPPTEAFQEALTKEAANSRLLQLAGVESIVNGMDWEQKRTDAWSQEAHKAVWGEGTAGIDAASEDDEMRMLVGGDVNFGQQPVQQPTPQQQPPAPPTPRTPSKLGSAALVAATVVGGGLVGMAVSQMVSPAAEFEDTNTQVEFGIGMPDQPQK